MVPGFHVWNHGPALTRIPLPKTWTPNDSISNDLNFQPYYQRKWEMPIKLFFNQLERWAEDCEHPRSIAPQDQFIQIANIHDDSSVPSHLKRDILKSLTEK